VSMADVLASWTGAVPPLKLPDGQEVGGQVPGYGTFRTADGGWVALGVISEDHFWSALTRALGMDDAASLSFAERLALGARLTARITDAIGERRRDELVRDLAAAGVPASPVLSQDEMLRTEHFRARGTVADGPDGEPAVRHPIRYRKHPAQAPREVPPLLEGSARLPSWHEVTASGERATGRGP
jgi:crotonobetainyl-CoA:carnitine CoA-transferase CaiB-like acyl-CoA transferase